MIEGRSARRRASFFAFGATVLGVGLVFGACTSVQRSNGDTCIKGEDCLSGICVDNTCVAAPTYLDAETNAPGSDATTDTGTRSDTGAGAADTGQAKETGTTTEAGGTMGGSDSGAD